MAKGGMTSNAKGANAAKIAKAAARRVEALELRKRGKSYRAIADALGVTVPTAHKDVTDALAELSALEGDKANELRQLEIERLTEAMEQVDKVIATCDTHGDEAAELRLKAVDRRVKLSESLRKLCGLDAPERKDITSGGEPMKGIIGIDPREV